MRSSQLFTFGGHSCFGNQDGKLVAAHDGAFSGSCHDCFVEDSVSGQGPIFQCRCDPIPGRSWVYPGEFARYPVVGTLGAFGSEACECEYDADLRPQTSILMSLMARCGVLVRLLMTATIDMSCGNGVGQDVGKYPFLRATKGGHPLL